MTIPVGTALRAAAWRSSIIFISVMICSYCDREMPDISAYCPDCGRAVKSDAQARGDWDVRAPSFEAAILGALAYVTILPAALFLAIPRLRRESFVRLHCWQSILFALATIVAIVLMRLLFALLSLLPGVGFLLACLSVGVVFIAFVIVWVVLVVKAGLGQTYKLPGIGQQAARLAR
jgi:uncharacterized membrane protein